MASKSPLDLTELSLTPDLQFWTRIFWRRLYSFVWWHSHFLSKRALGLLFSESSESSAWHVDFGFENIVPYNKWSIYLFKKQVWLANTTITDCSLEVETQDRDHQKNCIKERVLLRTQNKCFELMVRNLLNNFVNLDQWLILLPLCMQVSDDNNTVMIEFTPTIPHYSMATQIKINFLISNTKHMLLVLKRTVSMRRFFWKPKTNVFN